MEREEWLCAHGVYFSICADVEVCEVRYVIGNEMIFGHAPYGASYEEIEANFIEPAYQHIRSVMESQNAR
jgi:hypothetical protein